ncbi:MAG: DinB family protein [Thermomicrobiales bacterium]
MHATADGTGCGASSIDGVPLTAAWDTSAGAPFPSGSDHHADVGPGDGSEGVARPAPTRDRATILNALVAVLVDFERLLEGKSQEALTQPSHDGGWGMVEILPHMRDWEEINHQRIARILEEDRPTLECLDDSLWSIEHDYSSQDPHKTFEQFRNLRSALVAHVSDLDEEAWARGAVLEGTGEITLHWLLDDICEHDVVHLAQAREVLV